MRGGALALAVWTALAALPAAGQTLPAAYRVAGVAADDVLNIRAAPSAAAPIVGTIGPFAVAVEVLELSADGRWGRVPLPEGSGWVAMRFLQATPPADPAEVPRPLSCYGTEPFWRLGLHPRGAEWTTPEGGPWPLDEIEAEAAPGGFLVRLAGQDGAGPWASVTLLALREPCTDGMSDRPFGLSARLFLQGADGAQALAGCCSLDHR